MTTNLNSKIGFRNAHQTPYGRNKLKHLKNQILFYLLTLSRSSNILIAPESYRKMLNSCANRELCLNSEINQLIY